MTPRAARRGSVALLSLLSVAAPALAQVNSGAIYGVVASGGQRLEGATITVTSDAAPLTLRSDARGEFRALSLPPGDYDVSVVLDGYWPASFEHVALEVGQSVSLEAALVQAAERVTVAPSATPLLERRGVSRGTNLDQAELERLPTARDAWEAARQTPGVLVDRVNIAGNESTEPSAIAGPGYAMTQQAWSVDGVVVTDSVTPGIAASFFDFDAFQQIEVRTGGSDVGLATGGAVNLVTRRGTNAWRGSARLLAATGSLQWSPAAHPARLAAAGPWNLGRAQGAIEGGNRIDLSRDAGFEFGGPLLRDRVWAWGAFGRQDIDLFTIGDFREQSTFNAVSAKVDGVTKGTVWQGLYLRDRRMKTGRNVGPLRPPDTAWDFPVTTAIAKAEASRTLRSRYFVTGAVSHVQEDLAAQPAGGLDVNAVLEPSGVWSGSFVYGREHRPQVGVKVDTRSFTALGRFSSEWHVGFDHRRAWTDSVARWPGPGGVIGLGTTVYTLGVPLALATVGGHNEDDRSITAVYGQNTFTHGRFTLNTGVRADWQGGSNRASTLPANTLLPTLLPGLNFRGLQDAVSWRSITPKLGLVYALDEGSTTLLQASYRQFPDELSLTDIQHSNPTRYQPGGIIGVAQSVTFIWLDNGDLKFAPGEIGPVVASSAIDPTRPGFFPNATAPGFHSPRTHEAILGVERELGHGIVTGVDLTWHRTTDLAQLDRLVFDDAAGARSGVGRPHTAADYVLAERLTGVLPDGSGYSVPVYRLRPGLTWLGGSLLTNGRRQQRYAGLTASARRRFDGSWMLRGWVNVNRWNWGVPAGTAIDPTPTMEGAFEDGAAVLQDAASFGGLKTSVFINARWSFNVAGLYRVAASRPWSFDVATDIYGRQGYPVPYFRQVSGVESGDGIDRQVRVSSSAADYRNDPVVNVNARLEKTRTVGRASIAFGLDLFNLFNRTSVLQRQHELNLPVGDYVIEAVNPRVARVGVRVRWG
ncbi:MAG TPA: TonB-dependent receptor [Vicinamibacterales bacterium]|nr:TonB-dependent receptor [Vicinamibacterales bacterium]